MEATVYNKTGKKAGSIALPEEYFGLAWNADLVHDVVTALETNARDNVAHTKDRSDVSGGGKKPWRQKGTGRARHGSTRSPIWVGGGVSHGPRNEKNFDRKINKKAKQKALFVALSKKFKDGEVIFVDSLSSEKPSTKEAQSFIEAVKKTDEGKKIEKKVKNAMLIALGENDKNTKKSFSNIKSAEVLDAKSISVVDVLNKTILVIENPDKVFADFGSKKLYASK